ncbi:helix-turn-helix domain-containing protein [Mycobacterium sp. Aquia_216]|uniref:helix-turn-helix transcriptional regulator n=1 Tax=Mycobacterium sp. Aquia_216 TaxID=2991729 RepID=UPI00227A2535|nr:helix-turn-helix domain-containing protein [Mycobacterium sp. Aquia_216]WAJ43131.1 helix-turn-helix domain-containing protein [Mycobacterium sp. Aquia_216]
MSTTNDEKELLTAEDLEVLTGTPRSTFRYWAHIGRGPASFKIGRRRVWRRSVVMSWLAEQERKTSSDRAS